MSENLCQLCSAKIGSYYGASSLFCCAGCETVYAILSSKNKLQDFKKEPVFQKAMSAGIIANPQLLNQISSKEASQEFSEINKMVIELSGMWCPSCAEIIRYFLMQKEGVKSCVVDYVNDLASVEFSPRYFSKDDILKLIKQLGYEAEELDLKEQPKRKSLSVSFVIAAFCSLNVMMFAYPLYATYFNLNDRDYGLYFAWLSFYFSLPVITYCAWPIYRRFWLSMKVGQFGMETLVVIGVATSFLLSTYQLLQGSDLVYFDSMTVIVTLVLLGKILENKAKLTSKNLMYQLSKTFQRKARIKTENGENKFIPLKEIEVGGILVVCQGEKIPLDGLIVEGQGLFDESVVTGEAMPIEKKEGDSAISGAILQSGWICLRVSSKAEQSFLSQIVKIVEQEIHAKPAYRKLIDNIVNWFVPIILTIALGNFVWLFTHQTFQEAALTALSILLISCPCAIGIAAPIAEAHLIEELSSRGLFVRDRNILSDLPRIDCFIFDKTGTITKGQFKVLSINKMDDQESSVLKSMTERSNHPVSQAIYRNIASTPAKLCSCQEIAGKGLIAWVEGDRFLLGSKNFIESFGIKIKDNPQHKIFSTIVYFCKNSDVLQVFHLGDELKEKIPMIISSLESPTILLSGDVEDNVRTIANQCGFSTWKAACTPFDKKNYIDQLRKEGKCVCMIGDGINDAAALASSNIGIAIKTATDISSFASNAMLTTEDLSILAELKSQGLRGQKILRQNLFWAFIYNIIGVGLALCGLLTPIFSALAMTLSSLVVVLNAKRIRKKYNWGI